MLTTVSIVSKLKDFKKSRGPVFNIESMGLFGSCARGEQNDKSDIDIFIKMGKCGALTFGRVKDELEELLNTQIDLVSLGAVMHPSFRQSLEKDAIYI